MALNLQLGLLAVAGILLATDLCDGLKIGAFKVKILGPTKIGNPDVVNVLVQIIRRYDVILVQDIRDVGGVIVVPRLLSAVNRGSEYTYQGEVSGNLGRSKQKARYAYLYRNETVEVCDRYQFDDPDDYFEREPFSILISCKQPDDSEIDPWKFFLLGVHVKPSRVRSELGALGKAYRNTSAAFNSTSGLILGDLNADCSYLSGCPFQDLEIVTYPFASWLIDFSVDTTTTPTYCAYDRIIAVDDTRDHVVPDSAQVYRFDTDLSLSPEQAEAVSDHYPVEVEILKEARCLKTIVLIVVLSTHREAHSAGPHIVMITTHSENRTHTLQVKDKSSNKLPNKIECDLTEDFGFRECLKPSDIKKITIVPDSTDAWNLTSVVTLAYDTCGKVTLITHDICIDFAVVLDNRGNGQPLCLTPVNRGPLCLTPVNRGPLCLTPVN